MNTLLKLMILGGKVALGFTVLFGLCTVLFVAGLFGIGPFLFTLVIYGTIFYGGYWAYRRWHNHRIFRSSSLWQYGLLAALLMAITGFVYGLIRTGVR